MGERERRRRAALSAGERLVEHRELLLRAALFPAKLRQHSLLLRPRRDDGEPVTGAQITAIFDNPELRPAEVQVAPRVLSFDIETTARSDRLLAISLYVGLVVANFIWLWPILNSPAAVVKMPAIGVVMRVVAWRFSA